MSVRIELFGIPRHRTGVSQLEVDARTLGDALAAAGRTVPQLALSCLDGDRLRAGFLASVNGRMFVSDPGTPLLSGDCVLIVSSDAGG
jgi:molybdopterin converting factor small subunit